MKQIIRFSLSLVMLGMLALASQAAALEPLSKNSYVTDRLVAARVADRIRKACPDQIGARVVYAFSQAMKLNNWAEAQGYSHAEIKGFLKDKNEKAVIYASAEKYLAANGATNGDKTGFCALGLKEIAANSIAGSLIYKK